MERVSKNANDGAILDIYPNLGETEAFDCLSRYLASFEHDIKLNALHREQQSSEGAEQDILAALSGVREHVERLKQRFAGWAD